MSNHAVCPECGEEVVNKAPTTISPDAGPKQPWSHRDGSPLCPVVGRRGYEAAKPQEGWKRR